MFWDAKKMEEQRKAERERQEKLRKQRDEAKKLAKKVTQQKEIKRKERAEETFNTDYGVPLELGIEDNGEGGKRPGGAGSAIGRTMGGGTGSGYRHGSNRTPLPGARGAAPPPGVTPNRFGNSAGTSGSDHGGGQKGESNMPSLNRRLKF